MLRQMSTFELSMMRLDVRQESTRHTEVMDAITTYLGMGSYASWDEVSRGDGANGVEDMAPNSLHAHPAEPSLLP